MWSARVVEGEERGVLRYAIRSGSEPATYRDVVAAFRTDEGFRKWFSGVLAEIPYVAFRWETPAVTASRVDRTFEFVVLESPGLAREPEPEAFAERFELDVSGDVLVFPNLGGDAIMVVPRPIAAHAVYAHLGAFVRNAPEAQRLALWQAVGDAMARRLGTKPVWLSTAGAGVSWLHVRLDDRPKYYAYAPFRVAP
jgi:hypothetical protein